MEVSIEQRCAPLDETEKKKEELRMLNRLVVLGLKCLYF